MGGGKGGGAGLQPWNNGGGRSREAGEEGMGGKIPKGAGAKKIGKKLGKIAQYF